MQAKPTKVVPYTAEEKKEGAKPKGKAPFIPLKDSMQRRLQK